MAGDPFGQGYGGLRLKGEVAVSDCWVKAGLAGGQAGLAGCQSGLDGCQALLAGCQAGLAGSQAGLPGPQAGPAGAGSQVTLAGVVL